MALTTLPIPKWKQRIASFPVGYTPACVLTWGPWSDLNRPGAASTVEGEEFVKGQLRLGDHIHDMPYAFSKSIVAVPSWTAKCVQTVSAYNCEKYQFEGDGRVFTAIAPSELLWTSTVSPSETDQAFALNLSVMKAKARLRKADVSLPMLIRERAETIRALGQQSQRLLTLVRERQSTDVARFRKLTRGRSHPEKVKAAAQMIADEHLQWIFGILPLMEDMVGIAKHVQREDLRTLTGRGRHTVIRTTESSVAPSSSNYAFGTKKKVTARYSVRTALKADVKLEVLGRLQLLGFNPLQSLYDFVPLSFVTGWFSNFNYWIQSLDPLYSSEYRTGSSSIWKEITLTKETVASKVSTRTSQGSGDSMGYSLSAERVVHTTEPPLGDLEFYNNFSLYSVTAGASLLVQKYLKLADRAIKVKPFRYRSKRPVHLPPITYRSPK